MRRQGQVIREKRFKFKKYLQGKFIDIIKKGSKLTWIELANKLDLHPHTIRVDWYKENSTIPYGKIKELIKLYPFIDLNELKTKWVECELPCNWGQRKAGEIRKKIIQIPTQSKELAELFGVILGDGYVGEKELVISSNSLEKAHVNYISRKIYTLFGLKPKIFLSYNNKNNLLTDVYSKNLIEFLKSNNLKIGNKIKNKNSLPQWIFKNKEFMRGALRGFFDTDGGIYHKQKKYKRAIIEFQTHSPYIREDIIKILKKLNFRSSKSTFNIRIQNQDEIHKFFREIGSANPKNIVRYKSFLNKQYVPNTKEIKYKVKNFKGDLPYMRL